MATEPDNGPNRLGRVFAHLPAVASAGFLVSYGILRPSTEFFYAQLGLTPEDVGLSQSAIVARSVSYAALLVLSLAIPAALFGIAWMLGQSVKQSAFYPRLLRALGQIWEQSRIFRVVTIVVGLGALAWFIARMVRQQTQPGGPAASFDIEGDGSWTSILLSTVAISVGFSLFGFLLGIVPYQDLVPMGLRSLLRKVATPSALLLTLVIAMAAMVALWDGATRAGEELMNGNAFSKKSQSAIFWIQTPIVPVHLVATADPLKICGNGQYPYALGKANESTSLILLYKEGQPSIIVRAASSSYRIDRGVRSASLDCGK
jgi:hypothetical protein